MRKTINRWVWLLVAAVILVTLLVALSGRQPVARISAVTVVRENLNATITSNGKVEPIQPYAIRAKASGFVENVLVVEGQPVRRGQVLVRLSDAEARADLARVREQLVAAEENLRAARAGGRADDAAQIESDLRKAQVDRERLRREQEALERLVTKQAATKNELDQNQIQLARAEAEWQRLQTAKEEFARRAKLNVERAALEVERYQSEVHTYNDRVRSTEVTAPVDGTLYSLPVRPRDFVRPGDVILELADLRRVRVRVFIDEPELGSVEPNQAMDITWDALPNQTWRGRAEQVPKQVVARGNRSVGEVLCTVENEKLELIPNINVNVRMYVRERRNALVVPRGAVQIDGTRRFVFVLGEGRVGVKKSRLQKREIKVGIASATKFEVLDGLLEGERVALPGEVDLKDGMGVRVVEPNRGL